MVLLEIALNLQINMGKNQHLNNTVLKPMTVKLSRTLWGLQAQTPSGSHTSCYVERLQPPRPSLSSEEQI